MFIRCLLAATAWVTLEVCEIVDGNQSPKLILLKKTLNNLFTIFNFLLGRG